MSKTPERMKPSKTERPYYLTQDTNEVIRALVDPKTYEKNKNLYTQACNRYFDQVQKIIEKAGFNVTAFREEEIERGLIELLRDYIGNEKYLIVSLDRFLLSELEGKNFIRLGITRPANAAGYVARIGAADLNMQLDRIAELAKGLEVVLADDGSFTGGTLAFVRALLEKQGLEIVDTVVFLTKQTTGLRYPNNETACNI